MIEKRRCIMLIADGLGDRPISLLSGKTTLEYAKTPTLDRLCKKGAAGLVHPYRPGVRCGTDWGHLSLFGYDPEMFYTGRGSIEAYSGGIILRKGDVAFRGNLASVDKELRVMDRRAGRISDRKQIQALLDAVAGLQIRGYSLEIKPLTEHRLALVLRGKGLNGTIPDTDPGTAREGEFVKNPIDSAEPSGRNTAAVLWEFLIKIHEIWNDHPVNQERRLKGDFPVNFILTRGSGNAMVLPPFAEHYPGVRVAIIAGDITITGIGRMCGFDAYKEGTFSGGISTNYMGKAKLAAELAEKYDLVVVHIKGTDLCGHDNLPFEKVSIIEKIDSMFQYWLEKLGEESCYYAMTADHSTPCEIKDHSADPIPAFFTGPDVRSDEVCEYGERACAKGILNHYTGAQMMSTIMDYLGFNKKYGA